MNEDIYLFQTLKTRDCGWRSMVLKPRAASIIIIDLPFKVIVIRPFGLSLIFHNHGHHKLSTSPKTYIQTKNRI